MIIQFCPLYHGERQSKLFPKSLRFKTLLVRVTSLPSLQPFSFRGIEDEDEGLSKHPSGKTWEPKSRLQCEILCKVMVPEGLEAPSSTHFWPYLCALNLTIHHNSKSSVRHVKFLLPWASFPSLHPLRISSTMYYISIPSDFKRIYLGYRKENILN